MDTDHKVINKFLELFPDTLAKGLFYSLDQNMINDEDLALLREYLSYEENYKLPFTKKLSASHLKFYEEAKKLNTFINLHFFRHNGSLVLHPELKSTMTEKYKVFADELAVLTEEVERANKVFRVLIEKETFLNNTATEIATNKKYSTVNEDILSIIGIKIKGNYIIRGTKKIKIDSTGKKIIYYLFYKSENNEDECLTLDDLSKAEEIKKAVGTIRNSISFVNKLITDLLPKKENIRIPKFIEKNKRGYRLNPKILHTKSKK